MWFCHLEHLDIFARIKSTNCFLLILYPVDEFSEHFIAINVTNISIEIRHDFDANEILLSRISDASFVVFSFAFQKTFLYHYKIQTVA